MSTTDNQIVRIHDMVKTFGNWGEWDRLVSAMSDQYGSYVGPTTNTSADPDTWQSWNNSTSVSSSNFDGRLCPNKHAWQWANNYIAGTFKVDENNSLLSNQLVPNEKLIWTPMTSENTLLLKHEGNVLNEDEYFNVPYQGGIYKINVFYTNASDYEVISNITANSGYGSGSSIGGDDTTDTTDSYVTIEKNKNHIILTVPKNLGTTILGTLSFSVTHNDGTTTTKNISIRQLGFSFYTFSTTTKLKFPSNESSQNISIVHSGPWDIYYKPSWVTVSPAYCNDYASDKGSSLPNITETVSITCQSSTENRTGSVIFRSEGKDAYASIEQTIDPIITFNVSSLSFGASGGTKIVTVETLNISELTLDETTVTEWLTIERNKNEFTISASSNLGGARNVNLRFAGTGYNGDTISKVLTVSQTGVSISISPLNMQRGFGNFIISGTRVNISNSRLSNATYKILGTAAAFNYRVNCPAGIPWKVVQKPDWVHMDQMHGTNTTATNMKGSVFPFIYVEPNYTGEMRTGEVIVCVENGSASAALTIIQNVGDVLDTYVDPQVTYVTQDGGIFSKSFSKTNDSVSSWVALTTSYGWSSSFGQYTPANGNFTSTNALSANIRAGINTSQYDGLIWIGISPTRTGANQNPAIFNIKGTNPAYSFHPEESPSEPETPEYSLSLSKTSWNAAQTVSSTTLDVTAIGPWTATSNADWLTVSPSSGVGDEEESISTVTVSAAENTSTSTRTGKITFVCGDSTTSLTEILTVTQDAYVPPTDSISLSKTSWTVSNSASETTVTVTSSGTWTASSNQSWISVAPSIGSSGRTVQIAITANSASSSRNGTVTFECGEAAATLSITQNAGSTTPTYTYDFYLSPSTLTLDVGSGQYMYAWFVTYDSTGAKVSEEDVYTQCTWTTDDSDIASVSANGYVTGVKNGSTYVNAYYNGFYSRSFVNVVGGSEPDEPDVETTYELKIDPSSITVQAGSSTTANAILYTYENGSLKSTQNVSATWTSNNESVATVSGGTVTGVAEGNTQITAYYNGHYAYAPVNVTPKPVTVTYELEIYPSSLTIQVGSSANFTARYWKVIDGVKDGYTNITSSCNWSSGNTSIATVSGGTVTGKAVGNTSVTALYGNIFTSAPVTVTPSEDEPEQTVTSYKLELSPSSISIRKGESGSFTAIYSTLENGIEVSSQVVTSGVIWSSGNTSIATVSGGTVTGKAVGNTSVTATYQGQSAVGPVYVTPAEVSYSLSLTPSNTSITAGSGTSITATLYTTTNGVTDSGRSVTTSCSWKSSEPSIATVSNGYVSGKANQYGTVTITATYSTDNGDVSADAIVTVNYTYNYLELSASSVSLYVGDTYPLYATYYTVTNGVSSSQDVTSSASWSGGSGYVSCDSYGVVTAVKNSYNNVFNITASYGGKSASCGFTVSEKQENVYAISLSSYGGNFSASGGSQSTTVTSTLNGSGTTWGASSSNSWISVSPISGSNGASVSISASANTSTSNRSGYVTFATGPVGSQQTATYSVTQAGKEAKTLSSISVSPTSVSNFSNQTSPITVTAYYTDGTSAVVTNNLIGSGTNDNIAYYASGVVFHVNPGTATITIFHTHNGVTKSASISVTTEKVIPVSIDLSHPYWMSRNSSVTVSAVVTLSDGTTYVGPNIIFSTTGTVTTIAGQSGNTATISSGSSYGEDTITASYTFNGTTVSDSGKIGVTN